VFPGAKHDSPVLAERLWEAGMAGEELFEGLPEARGPERPRDRGAARMREPVRNQVELRACDLDSLLPEDHLARSIWDYVARLDLAALEAEIKAREHVAGQAPPSPRLVLALWLFAISQGVASARELARLCESHDAYRWLCGGVSVNYHGLSDFRAAHGALFDRLLTEHVASLSAAGVIDLDEVVQDGVKVRASAGSASFRRRKTLEGELAKAKALLERLDAENETDPGASDRRRKAARKRAAEERKRRVEKALEKHAEVEKQRERREKKNRNQTEKQGEPRTSTTDADARVMKMADGGFRPAYNCQIATVAQGQIVIAVSATTMGSDRGLMQPMIERIGRRYGRLPERHLVDAGFHKNEDIEQAAAQGVLVYGPPGRTKHGVDPYAPKYGDSESVVAWRKRMASPEGKEVYKRRSMGECVNANLRNRGLRQLPVRGLAKVEAVLALYALANNILAGFRLLAPRAQPA
jgi:transposase